MTRTRLAMAAAVIGIAAVLAAGYAARGQAGLTDAAAVAAVGVLIVARGTLRGGNQDPFGPVRRNRRRRSARKTSPPTVRSPPTWSGAGCPGGTTSTPSARCSPGWRPRSAAGCRPTCRRLPRTRTAPARTWPHWTA